MSMARIIEELRKIRGKLPKTSLSDTDKPLDTIIGLISAPDHVFIPSVNVADTSQTEVTVDGFLVYIKNSHKGGPVMANLDRPISPGEYTLIEPGTVKVIGRRTNKIYLQALQGYTSTVTIEALRLV